MQEGDEPSSARPAATAPQRAPVEIEAELLLQEMKVIKGSRFNAAERLRKKDRLTTIATTYLSIVVVIIAISGLVYHFPDWLQNATNLATTILSILIVVFSLIQYSSGDAVKAELHHRSATEVNGLLLRLRCSLAMGNPQIGDISSEYDAILRRYAASHEPVDFETYKLEHLSEYPARTEAAVEKLRRNVARDKRGFAQSVIYTLTAAMVFTLVLIFTAVILNYAGIDLIEVLRHSKSQ